MTDAEVLAANQTMLKALVAKQSLRDWRNYMGDAERRKTRVLLRDLINSGESKNLERVGGYYGVNLDG